MQLIRSILSSPWMVDERTAHAAMPMVLRLLKGEDVTVQPVADLRPYAYSVQSQQQARYYDLANAPAGSVAVHRVIGLVTKHDGMCSKGTETLMREMARADGMKNIAGHLLEIDSGGGEGTNIATVARFIDEKIEKPVIAWVSGTAASAAYWIAASADAIYAAEKTDMIGSIGVMVRFADFRDYYEKEGIKMHEIYAEQSDLKNADFRAALDGDYETLRNDFLNPYAESFIDAIREYRPMVDDDDAFRGKVFRAEEAVENFLIDGIMTYDDAVQEVRRMADEEKPYLTTSNSFNMKRIESILGYELEMNDGGVFLREDELKKIERRLVGPGEEPVEAEALQALDAKLDELDGIAAGLLTEMKAMKEQLDLTSERIDQTEANLEQLKSSPGDKPTIAHSGTDTPPADDELDEFEKQARAYAQKNARFIG